MLYLKQTNKISPKQNPNQPPLTKSLPKTTLGIVADAVWNKFNCEM